MTLPPYLACDLPRPPRHLITPAVSGILGTRSYAFHNGAMLCYEVPGGPNNIIGGRHV
jgi:hypothetical protein